MLAKNITTFAMMLTNVVQDIHANGEISRITVDVFLVSLMMDKSLNLNVSIMSYIYFFGTLLLIYLMIFKRNHNVGTKDFVASLKKKETSLKSGGDL